MAHWIWGVALILGLFTVPVSGVAQNVPDPLLERQRQLELARRTNALSDFDGGQATDLEVLAVQEGGACFDLDTIDVTGVTIFPKKAIDLIIADHVPGCVSGSAIQSIMQRLDAMYAEAGHITTRTFIPAQNILGRRLQLDVVEGFVEKIFVVGDGKIVDTAESARQVRLAFPKVEGDVFQLRTLEQGLDQMNRLPSVDAKVELQPGNEIGGTFLVLERKQGKRRRGWVRANNLGSENTGRYTLSFDTEYDDVFSANDTWTFNLESTQNTNALLFFGSVPWGYWTFSGQVGYSEYLLPLTEFSELFGTSRTLSLTANRVIRRDEESKTDVSVTLNRRQSGRHINDAALTPQSLSTLAIKMNHQSLKGAVRNSFDAGLTFGLPYLGADKDPADLSFELPHAQFVKFSGGWQRQSVVEGWGALISDLRVQYSPSTLYGSETMSLGSSNSVRGYENAVGSGENGLILRNDLYLNDEILPGRMAEFVQVNLFSDVGTVYDRSTRKEVYAAGAGIGLGFGYGRMTGTATLAVPLIEDGKWQVGDLYFGLQINVKAW